MNSPRESVKNFHREVQRSQSKSKRVNTNLISVYDVESISDQELRRLSFAFEVTERSCELYRAIVLLLWNTDIRALPNADVALHSDSDSDEGRNSVYDEEPRGGVDIRDFLTAEWSRGGPSVNGEALTSRISRISLCEKSIVDSRKDVKESFSRQCTKLIFPLSASLAVPISSAFQAPSRWISLGIEEMISLVLPCVFLAKRLL